MMLIKNLRYEKKGKELSQYYLDRFVERADRLLRSLKLEEHLCLMSFGSSGSRFLTGNSDTDFSVIDDGTVSEEDISRLQRSIYHEFADAPWHVSFKCWERLSVNPMDVISLYFICGNKKLFSEKVLNNPKIADVINTDNLVTLLVGNDLHIEFMSSRFFSRLLNKYHPKWELPVPISFGDVKYYTGGLRSIQYIYMTVMLLRNKRYISDLTREDFISAGFLTEQEILSIDKALDFMLAAKDICKEGNNIFYSSNMAALNKYWNQSSDEIKAEYEYHAGSVRSVCKKAHQALINAFPCNEGVVARTCTDTSVLKKIVLTDSLELWRTLALRSDLTGDSRKLLWDKISERRESHPHTMLDELAVMMDYSSNPNENAVDTEAEKTDLWFTNNVFRCFEEVLGNDTDDPVLIRLAVHTAFLEMYLSGKVPDPEHYYFEFFDRVRKYFHCHTLYPDRETEAAKEACKQIMSSGLFIRGNLTLMEVHPTNHCNLQCQWCTYGDRDKTVSLRYEDIYKAAGMNPSEVLIAGGGEPTLFRDGAHDFSDVIHCFRTELPGARLRLITNGTYIPKGKWTEEIDEISISIDDSSAEDYLENKGTDLFERVWHNIEEYLKRKSPTIIRVTKIYTKDNIMDSLMLAEKLYDLWRGISARSAKKRYFRFMVFPMANDHKQGAAYASSILDNSRREEWKEALNGVSVSNPGMFRFFKEHTNLITVADGVPSEKPTGYCSNPAHYLLLGADGMIYPCFASCSSFSNVNLGPIDQDAAILYEKRCDLFYRKPMNCEAGCRPGNVFYGQRSREYFEAQQKLGLPFLEKPRYVEPVVVHVSYQDPDHIMGGQGWAVTNLCREQTRQCRAVYWISPCVKDEVPGEYFYENGRLRVIKLKFTDKYVETLFSDDYENHILREEFGRVAEAELIKRFKPDECIIHLHGFIEVPSHSERLRSLGYGVLSTFHMLLSTRRQHIISSGGDLSYMKEAERKAIASNAYISIPAKGMIDEMSAVCPDYRGIFECIPNGIGDEHFETAKSIFDSTRKTIVSYGRISPEKGFDFLIEAAKMYYRDAEEAKSNTTDFVIFGNTDMSVKARRLYARKLIDMAYGYRGIRVLASAAGLIGTDKINMIDRSVFGVIPSLYEPFGLVIPEIMARGKPVITTCTTGACDIMKTNKIGRNDFGFIVDQTPGSIYEAIAWMLDHPEECEQMGRNAFERAQDFRWSLISEQFSELYEKIFGLRN